MPEDLSRNQSLFALTSYCNTIGQSNNGFSILGFSLAGERRVPVFDLIDLIHPLADKRNKEHLTETIFHGHTKIALTNLITESTWFLSLGISNVR